MKTFYLLTFNVTDRCGHLALYSDLTFAKIQTENRSRSDCTEGPYAARYQDATYEWIEMDDPKKYCLMINLQTVDPRWRQLPTGYYLEPIELADVETFSGPWPVVITRHPVSSSNVRAVGYDAPTRTLEIEYRSGGVYQYSRVPQDVYDRLIDSESIGRFIAANIIPSRDYTCLRIAD